MPPEPAETQTSRPRIAALDGLRAVALLLVFAFHTWEFSGHPYIPVLSSVIGQNTRPDFFVVLTGFLLYLPLAREPGRADRFSSRGFVVRRLRRIVPPYYVALLLALTLPVVLKAAVWATGGTSHPIELPSLGDVVAHLTFTQLFFADYWASINGSLWAMSLEMQLYLLFPLVVLLLVRRGPRALVLVYLSSIVYRVVVWLLLADHPWPAEFLWAANGVGRLTEMLTGMLAAHVVSHWRPTRNRPAVVVLGASFLGGYGIAVWVPSGPLPLREMALGVAFSALVLVGVWSAHAARALSWAPVRRLGLMAYSVFLGHQPLVYYLSQLMRERFKLGDGIPHLLVLWTVGFGVVLIVGLALFRWVEVPSTAWSRRAPTVKYPDPDQGSSRV